MHAFTRFSQFHHSARAALCALAVLSCATAARAEDPQRPGLNWVRLRGAESCLSAPELAQRVELRVGRMLFASVSDAGIFVDGYVGRSREGWDVTLEVSDREGALLGRRELHVPGADCNVIDEAVTLVIAVTLYPNTAMMEGGIALDPATSAKLLALFGQESVDPDPALLAPATPRPESRAEVRAVRGAGVDRVSASTDRAAIEEPGPDVQGGAFELGFDAVAIGALGQLPGFAAGAGVRVGLRAPGAFPIEVGGSLLPSSIETAGNVSGRARFALLLGSLSACPVEPEWLRASALCGGAEIGQLEVEASGFAEDNRSVSDLVANLLLSALYRPELAAGIHLRVAAVLAVPLIQRSYGFEALDGTDAPLFRMPQLAGRLELGLAVQF